MGYSGLIFNTVTQFILQAQKTKQVVKRNDLDKLTEVWVGPAGGEDAFIPAIGAQHSQYNLMRLAAADSRQMPGLVVEVSLHYQGKLENSGSGTYTSVPTINRYFLDGELSYQEGSATYSLRYTGRCVELNFITNLVPNGNPTYLGLATGYSGIQNQWEMVTEQNLSTSGETIGTGAPYSRMDCTDVRIEDSADGWYKITETYQTRMYPGVVYHGPPPSPRPQGTAGNHLISAPSAQSTSGDDQLNAQAAGGVQIPVTYPAGSGGQGSGINPDPAFYTEQEYVNADTTTTTGLDPNATSDQQAAGSAAASDSQSTDTFSLYLGLGLGGGTTSVKAKPSVSRRLHF